MKVVFVNPMIQLNGWDCYFVGRHIDRQKNSLPHGMLHMATIMKQKGIDVKMVDLRELKGWNDYVSILIDEEPDWLGISSMSVDLYFALDAAKIAKELFPEAKTVVGGVHATQNPQDIVDKDFVDYVFRYEGEITFVKMVTGEYKPEDKVVEGEMPDVNKLPYVDRSLVNYERGELNYGAFWMAFHPYVTVLAGRGCPFDCAFCAPVAKDIFRKVRQRNPAHIVGEMVECKEKWDAAYYDFIDDTFTLDRKWVMAFCDQYEKSACAGTPFVGAARADMICKNEDIFKRLREVGCDTISVGFESGSDRMLKLYKKGTTVEMNLRAAKILRKYGFQIVSNCIWGGPTETLEESKATTRMLEKIKPEVSCTSFFTPYPGCDMYKWCKENDLILHDGDFKHYHRYAYEPKIKGIDYNAVGNIIYRA